MIQSFHQLRYRPRPHVAQDRARSGVGIVETDADTRLARLWLGFVGRLDDLRLAIVAMDDAMHGAEWRGHVGDEAEARIPAAGQLASLRPRAKCAWGQRSELW